MGRLVVLQASPRLPAGLLSRAAWQTLEQADLVAAADPGTPLPVALAAQGIDVACQPDASAERLLGLAGAGTVVWLSDELADAGLLTDLATAAVQRADGSGAGVPPGPELEVLVGSFDPVGARLLDLVDVMDQLRRECPWDRRQTHESLVRYSVEEVYEMVEAIETGDRDHLREELGDLLLQVMFHAQIAAEHPDSPFTIDDVASGIVDKLVRRHPHVFADTAVSGARDVEANWEAIKAAEKSRSSAMDGIPPGLPALSLAHKVVSRARHAKVPTSAPALDVRADTADSAASNPAALADALLAVVVAADEAGLDSEQLLRHRVRTLVTEVRSQEQRALDAEVPDRR